MSTYKFCKFCKLVREIGIGPESPLLLKSLFSYKDWK